MINSSVNQSTAAKCPNCGSFAVRRSHRRGLYERVISLGNIYPYNCNQCPGDIRFYYRKR